jgi:hypothetical protein
LRIIEFKKIKRGLDKIYLRKRNYDLLPESIVWRKNKFDLNPQIEFGCQNIMIK